MDLKNHYNRAIIESMAAKITHRWPDLDADAFVETATQDLDALEMKARVSQIADALHHHLPDDFPTAVDILTQTLSDKIPGDGWDGFRGFEVWPLTRFVATRGLDHFEASMVALEAMTQRFTAEFAIRPFLIKDPERTLTQLQKWRDHPSLHVRRLVSEGSRPRLPCGQRLTAFVRDPTPILELIEPLRGDPELYVRRSVANSLNDITKDHPEAALATLERWSGEGGKELEWLVKHACRTLVKAGHPRALALLGFDPEPEIEVGALSLVSSAICLGDALEFTAAVRSCADAPVRLAIDYVIHHKKANGKRTPKVFKLSKKTLGPGEQVEIVRRHKIKPISTRKYYSGEHLLELQINGKRFGRAIFTLEVPP